MSKNEEYALSIYDDLHGIVHLTKPEKEIVESPYFQRLRRIKQLGLANLVFPAAEHTRFAHSIGTLSVAERVCKHLNLCKDERRLLRMAALLHDIGHFPLSHTIESAYKSLRKAKIGEKEVEQKGKNKKNILPVVPSSIPSTEEFGADAQLHEVLGHDIILRTDSRRGITHILKDNDFNPEEIAPLLVGQHENLLLNQLLHSDLDVDQMDWRLRDAKNTGIVYGMYDLDYIIECMQVVRLGKQDILCFKVKAIGALEHYAIAKYYYFTQILYHKTRYIIDQIVSTIFQELTKKKLFCTRDYDEIVEKINDGWFLKFDDRFFFRLIDKAENSNKVDKGIKELIGMIKHRKLPKRHKEKNLIHSKGSVRAQRQLDIIRDKFNEESKQINRDNLLAKYGLSFLEEDFSLADNLKEMIKKSTLKNKSEVKSDYSKPIRIILKNKDRPDLLNDLPGSLMERLANLQNSIFRIYWMPD